MDDPKDDPAIVVLVADNTSGQQCLALPTFLILPGTMPLQQGIKETYDVVKLIYFIQEAHQQYT